MTKKEILISRVLARFSFVAPTVVQIEEFLSENKESGRLFDDVYGDTIGGIAKLRRSLMSSRRGVVIRNRANQ